MCKSDLALIIVRWTSVARRFTFLLSGGAHVLRFVPVVNSHGPGHALGIRNLPCGCLLAARTVAGGGWWLAGSYSALPNRVWCMTSGALPMRTRCVAAASSATAIASSARGGCEQVISAA